MSRWWWSCGALKFVASGCLVTAALGWAYWPLLDAREDWSAMCGEWDDRANFAENDLVRKPLSMATAKQMWRERRVNVYEPCGWLLKALVQRAFATYDDATGLLDVASRAHRLATLALHWACSLSLFALLWRLVKSTPAALAGALFWATHPLHAEVVGWMSAQPYALAAFFALAALHAHVGGSRLGPVWYALAVLSKSVAVPAPAAIAALELARSTPPISAIKRLGGYVAVCAVAVPLTLHANRLGHDPLADVVQIEGLAMRCAKALVTVWFCASCVIKPARLSPHYVLDAYFWTRDDWSEVIVAAAATTTVGLAALERWRTRRPLLLAVAVHCAACYAPSCGIVQHGMIQKGGDRYSYLPLLGVSAAVAAGVEAGVVPAAAALVAAAAQAELTRRQVPVWRGDDALLTSALRVDPHDWRVLDTYAELLVRRGEHERARPMFQTALESVERLGLPSSPKERVFRGKILVLLGRADEGCALFEAARRDYPDSALAQNNVAVCDLRHAERRDAQGPNFERALALAYRDEHRDAIRHNLREFGAWRDRGYHGRIDATLVY